jgi:Tol biopolymer transport system component
MRSERWVKGMESKPSEIYVMNTNGSNEKNLTRNPADDWGPDWSGG